MALLPIKIYPSPILHQQSKEVAKVTPEIRKLLDSMAETMYASRGIGLAAPQIGVLQRLVVLDIHWSDEEGTAEKRIYHLINPKIIKRTGKIEWEEGCLSIPGFLQKMERAQKIVVEALDRNGKAITIEGEDLLAVALQHEIDHLDGKLIIDKATRIKKNLWLEQQQK